MTNILLALLEKTIIALLSRLSSLDWNAVRTEVLNVWNAGLTGEQKRMMVYARLREISSIGASWLIFAAIEIAVGKIKIEQAKQ